MNVIRIVSADVQKRKWQISHQYRTWNLYPLKLPSFEDIRQVAPHGYKHFSINLKVLPHPQVAGIMFRKDTWKICACLI